jgi:hypothetical protein
LTLVARHSALSRPSRRLDDVATIANQMAIRQMRLILRLQFNSGGARLIDDAELRLERDRWLMSVHVFGLVQ